LLAANGTTEIFYEEASAQSAGKRFACCDPPCTGQFLFIALKPFDVAGDFNRDTLAGECLLDVRLYWPAIAIEAHKRF
jgi:hypothetical protein